MKREAAMKNMEGTLKAYMMHSLLDDSVQHSSVEDSLIQELKKEVMKEFERHLDDLIRASLAAPTPLVGILTEMTTASGTQRFIANNKQYMTELALSFVETNYNDDGELIQH